MLLIGAVAFFAGLSAGAQVPRSSSHRRSFRNPLPVSLADPYVLLYKGRYYLYGTGGVQGFTAYTSTDLADWKPLGQVYRAAASSWGSGDFWAPEVYAVHGKFYLFYSAQWKTNPGNEKENFRIGVAVADSPEGPFKDYADQPVFDPGYPIIDANVFFDRDGKCYLYYSRCCYKHPVESELSQLAKQKGWYQDIEESWVYGVELQPDFRGVKGEPVLLLQPPKKLNDRQAEWESRSVTDREINRRWTEGSVTFRKGDDYYMMYSANYFGGKNYAVGYATGKSPLGPFSKAANNPALEKNTASGGTVTGTGHNSVTWSPDGKEMFCVYHARPTATGNDRVVCIDRMTAERGLLKIYGPTTQPQPLPSGAR